MHMKTLLRRVTFGVVGLVGTAHVTAIYFSHMGDAIWSVYGGLGACAITLALVVSSSYCLMVASSRKGFVAGY